MSRPEGAAAGRAVRGPTALDPAAAGGTPGASADRPTEPCLHCGFAVPVRLMGCKGGHCPNCRHPYPHGDCSD
ncbi:MAG: hypothetical protein PVF05_09615 [Gemmatimonadales bacterium]